METVSQKLEDSNREYVGKLEKMARLLDARAARIKVKLLLVCLCIAGYVTNLYP